MHEWLELLETLWPAQYVFILGHMRSRSSLLTHLLGSHPEISGYTESHIKYRNRWDLARLRWHISQAGGHWPTGRYLLDKQLHNRMYLPAQLRHSDRLRAVILIRPPMETVSSIVRMGERTGNRNDADPHRAAAYYCQRVATLTGLAIELRDRALLINSDHLVKNPRAVLDAIGAHLNLATPLQNHYELGRHTGKAGAGDISPLIRSRQIRAARSEPPPIALPKNLQRVLRDAYEHAVSDSAAWVAAIGFNECMPMQQSK